jgi:hypothetical protein
MRPRIRRLGAALAVPALAALGLTAVTITADASTASPVAPAVQATQLAPNYLANHANPVEEVAGDCAEITDNGGGGLSILSHGTDDIDVTVEPTGNCDVAVFPQTTDFGTAFEYENQSGNCLYLNPNSDTVTTASGCSDGDGFETWIGTRETDISGNAGFNFACTADNTLCAVSGSGNTAICADGSTSGSNVSEILDPTFDRDVCVWSAP